MSIVIAALGAFFGFLGYKATWDIANLSGALRQPELTLGLDKLRLSPANTGAVVSVLFGSAHLGEEKTVTIGAIPLTVANEGEKSVDNATLTIRFPQFMQRKTLDAMTFTKSGPVGASEIKKSVSSDASFDYSSYQVASLDPKVGLSVDEPFYATQTDRRFDVPFITKDGVPGTASIAMRYSVQWLITISGHDLPATNYTLEVAAARASSLDDLTMIAEKYAIPDKISNFRKELGFWEYLGGLAFRNDTGDLFVIYQENEEHKVDDGSLFSPGDSPKVARISFDLLSWNQLIQFH